MSPLILPGVADVASRIAVQATFNIPSGIVLLAQSLGLSARRRSSFAWLGDRPVDAIAIFGDAAAIDDQLADIQLFCEKNASSAERSAVEAVIWQLLLVHPLQDGNGRVARAMLLAFHRRFGDAAFIYLFWRLRFGRAAMFSQWASCGHVNLECTVQPLVDWFSLAEQLEECFSHMVREGVHEVALRSLCLQGEVSIRALSVASPNMGRSLGQKIVSSWEFYVRKNGRRWVARIDGLVASMIKNV